MDVSDKMPSLKNRTVLVTGGAGFVGSHLAARLLELGAKVVCFDDLSTGNKENIRPLIESYPKNFKFVKGDVNIRDELQVVFLSNKFDYVFHYAARVGVQRTYERPLEVLRDIDGIKNILELSKEHKVKKAVFASSSEVYGNPHTLPEKEDGHLNPQTPYGAVKLIGEHFFQSYQRMYGLRTCVLRFFNVFGPRQDSSAYGFVTGIFINQALACEPLTVFGDGSQTRSFIFVEDNVNASISALLSKKTDGEVVNLGVDRPITIIDLARKVIDLSGKSELNVKFIPRSPGDIVLHRKPCVLKMGKLIKYNPKVTLDEGLRRTLDWYRSHLS